MRYKIALKSTHFDDRDIIRWWRGTNVGGYYYEIVAGVYSFHTLLNMIMGWKNWDWRNWREGVAIQTQGSKDGYYALVIIREDHFLFNSDFVGTIRK